MANLNETDQWEEGVYQLEEDDPVLGGPTGIDNKAPRQLANRARYQRLRNVTPWDATFTYPANVAYVSYGGTSWKSVGESLNVMPGTDAAKWVRWAFTAAELGAVLGDAVTAHEAKANPHPQYATDDDLTGHINAANPHPQYATDDDLAGHVNAANPHAQYVRHDAAQGLTGLQAAQVRQNIGVEEAGTTLALIQKNAPMYAADTGAANAAVVAYAPALPALTDGMVLWFKAAATNTGAATLNVNGLGTKPIVGAAQSALQGGEIIANGRCMVIYSATLASFVLIECTGAAKQVPAGTQTGHAVQLGQFANAKSTAGYQKLPGGLILQWGTFSNSSNLQQVGLLFPLAFPTAVLAAYLTTNNATTSANGGSVYGMGANGMNAALNGGYSFYWLAIGY